MISPQQLVPPNPLTTRAQLVHLSYDRHHQRLAYAANNSVIIRPVDPTDATTVPTQFTGHGANATTVAEFAPLGNYIASGDVTGMVKIWDCAVLSGPAAADRDPFAQPTVKLEFPIIAGPIRSIAWDADLARVIAVGEGKDKFGRCFTWDSGNSVGEIMGHSGAVQAVSIRPQRPYRAVAGGDDKAVVFYQGPPFKFDKTLRGNHLNTVRDVKFSPQGTYFVSVGLDRAIVVYDGKTGDVLSTKAQAHQGGIYAVLWLSDDEFITASADGTLRQWKASALDSEPFTYVVSLKPTVDEQQLGVVVAGDWIVSVGFNGVLLYFTVGDAEVKHSVKGHQKPLTTVAVPTAEAVVSGLNDGTVFQWQRKQGVIQPFPQPGPRHANYVVDLIATKEGVQLVGWDDKLINGDHQATLPEQPKQAVYDAAHDLVYVVGELLITTYLGSSSEHKDKIALNYTALGLALVPNSQTILVLDATNNQVVVYEGSQEKQRWEKLRAAPVVVRVSPDGQYAAVADSFGKYVVYNVKDGLVVTLRWAFHTARVYDAQWLPDLKYVVSVGLDCQVIVFSIGRPAKLAKYPLAHQTGVLGVAWTDYDQGRFVTVGMDGVIKQWQVDLKQFD